MDEEDETSQRDKKMSLIQNQAAILASSFDSVMIFCTKHEEGGDTAHYSYGVGNWFARYGQITDWLNQERVVRAEEP